MEWLTNYGFELGRSLNQIKKGDYVFPCNRFPSQLEDLYNKIGCIANDKSICDLTLEGFRVVDIDYKEHKVFLAIDIDRSTKNRWTKLDGRFYFKRGKVTYDLMLVPTYVEPFVEQYGAKSPL